MDSYFHWQEVKIEGQLGGHGRGRGGCLKEPKVSECADESITHSSYSLRANYVKPSPPIHKTSFSGIQRASGQDFSRGHCWLCCHPGLGSSELWYSSIFNLWEKKLFPRPLKEVLFRLKGKFLQPSISCQLI